MSDDSDSQKHRQIATTVLRRASISDQESLLVWANRLLEIKNSSISGAQKARAAIACTVEMKAVVPFVKALGAEIKRVGWTERGLPARIGLSAAAVAAATLSGKAAGIAALGGAIGVPLWVVFGAGGAFAGVLIEEIKRTLPTASPKPGTSGRVIEGEVIDHKPPKPLA